ncbi:hypothetical protein EJ110_NYTH33167 [Nymphaea thermarum]|nr:hypothetical protein EJ110_NYTH33167 [Nymphaea thermarum]
MWPRLRRGFCSRSTKEWRVKQVVANFDSLLGEVKERIRDADFISISTQKSDFTLLRGAGFFPLTLPKWPTAKRIDFGGVLRLLIFREEELAAARVSAETVGAGISIAAPVEAAAAVACVEGEFDALPSAARLSVLALLPAPATVAFIGEGVDAVVLAAVRPGAAAKSANERIFLATRTSGFGVS